MADVKLVEIHASLFSLTMLWCCLRAVGAALPTSCTLLPTTSPNSPFTLGIYKPTQKETWKNCPDKIFCPFLIEFRLKVVVENINLFLKLSTFFALIEETSLLPFFPSYKLAFLIKLWVLDIFWPCSSQFGLTVT